MNKSRVGMKAAAFAEASLVLGGLDRRRAELPEGVLCEQLGELLTPIENSAHIIDSQLWVSAASTFPQRFADLWCSHSKVAAGGQ
jgi:hypothetical protein